MKEEGYFDLTLSACDDHKSRLDPQSHHSFSLIFVSKLKLDVLAPNLIGSNQDNLNNNLLFNYVFRIQQLSSIY